MNISIRMKEDPFGYFSFIHVIQDMLVDFSMVLEHAKYIKNKVGGVIGKKIQIL